MATVSTSINIGALTYAAAEAITINSGAILTIDAQVPADVASVNGTFPGSIACITFGELRIFNTSTTDPIVFQLSDFNKDFRFEKNGIFRATGSMIELAVGIGAAQSWDFSLAPLDVIPYPSYVEVETGVGTGEYIPRLVFTTAGKTIINNPSSWGSGDLFADILFWNATTRTLSSGDGVNGNVIATGCKVRIPNIYIHSSTTTSTQASRTLIDLAPTGRMFFQCVGISDHIYFSNSVPGDIDWFRVGFTGVFILSNTNASVRMSHCAFNADTTLATGNGPSFTSLLGPCNFYRIVSTHNTLTHGSNGVVWNLNFAPSCERHDSIYGYSKIRGATTGSAIELTQVSVTDGVMRDIVAIGAQFQITDMTDIVFEGARHCDQISGLQSTVNSQYVFLVATSARLRFNDLAMAGPSAARAGVISTDAKTVFIEFFGGSYDASNNTITAVFSGQGVGLFVYNFTINNLPAGAKIADSPTTFLSKSVDMRNVRATLTSTCLNEAAGMSNLDGVCGTPLNFNLAYAGGTDFCCAHLLNSGLMPTDGNIVFGSFGPGAMIEVSGSVQLDNAGAIEMPESGDVVVLTSQVFHGITSLGNVTPIYLPTAAPTTTTFEFAVAKSTGDFSTYVTLDAANLAAAVALIPGYTISDGLRIRIRATTFTTSAARVLNRIYFPTVYDPTFQAATATITIAGPAPTDVTTLYRASDDSVLGTLIGTGTISFFATVGLGAYFVRRTSTAVEIMRTQRAPFIMGLGNRGTVYLYAGDEVQLAQVEAINGIVTTTNATLQLAGLIPAAL